jgi:hypothetical protein
MAKRSLAEDLIEHARKMQEKEGPYLVIYDFKGSRSIPRFYDNLRKVLKKLDGTLLQRSVVHTPSYRCARAVMALADRYGAKVQGFKVSPI